MVPPRLSWPVGRVPLHSTARGEILDEGAASAFQQIDGLENVVYSTHIYKNKGDNWDKAFGNLSETHAVFAGEWGCMEASELDWGQQLLTYLNDHQIGWTAWSWSDKPHIVEPPVAPPCNPTQRGQRVLNVLSR